MTADGPNCGESFVPAPANGANWASLVERARLLRLQAADACARSRELRERFEELLRDQPRSRPGPNGGKQHRRAVGKA